MTTNNEPDVSAVLATVMSHILGPPMSNGAPCPCGADWQCPYIEQEARRLAWQWRREGIATCPCDCTTMPIAGPSMCIRCCELAVCDAALAVG